MLINFEKNLERKEKRLSKCLEAGQGKNYHKLKETQTNKSQ